MQAPAGILRFFVAAFAVTWVLQFPAVLVQRGLIAGQVESYMPLALLGVFGPTLAAVLVTALESGGSGIRELFRPLRFWRVGTAWYLIALGLPGLILAAGMAVYTLFGGSGGWFYPPENAARIVAALLIAFGEELGWRGFALPRLQERYGPLRASVFIGVLWALWHTPMFMGAGVPLSLLPIMVLFFVPGSLVLTWIYNRTGGSLLLVALAHLGAHLSNSHQALPATITPLLVHTLAYWIVAVTLIVFDRKLGHSFVAGA